MHAVVVTSDVWLRDSLKMMVAVVANCDAVGAGDCASASRLVEERRPDLVLVDAQLPMVEVRRLLEELAAVTPMVLCVVLVDWELQRQALATARADLVVVKGDPPARLFDKLELLLTNAGASRPLLLTS